MRAVLIDPTGRIAVDTRPDPVLPGPGGAVFEVAAAGICGSDLHFYEGEYPLSEPVALGHEAVGTVEIAELADDRHALRLLRLDELAVKELDQRLAGARLELVLAELDDHPADATGDDPRSGKIVDSNL